MKNFLLFSATLIVCFIFYGCPYESNIPIDAPSVKIDPSMLGTWEARKNEDEVYKISQQDEFTYQIVKSSKNSTDTESYLAHESSINGMRFWNIRKPSLDDSAPKYYLYKIDKKPEGMITMYEVTDNIDEQFESGKELKAFISSNMEKSFFYNKEEASYIKTGK